MPKVPRYEPNQVQEQLTPRVQNNIQTSRETFGGGQSTAGVFGAVQGLAKTVVDLKQRADDTLKKEGDVIFSKLQIDTSTNLKMLKGKDSVNYEKVLAEQWDKGVEEILKNYDGDAKEALSGIAQFRRMDLYKEANNHMVGEIDRYEAETHNSYLSALQNESVYYYQDKDKLKSNIEIQKAAIIDHGRQRGKDDVTIKTELDKAESGTHLKVLSRILNDQKDFDAIAYHKEFKDKFYGDDRKTASDLIEAARLRGESQKKSDSIIAKATDASQALEEARQIQDPKLRDETISRVKSYYNDKRQAENMSIEDLHRRSTDVIDKTGNVDDIPREDWARFSLTERSALKSYAEKRRQGTEPETSWVDYYDLRTMATAAPLREKFMQVNMMSYRNKLADAEFKELVKLQSDMREGRVNEKVLDGYRTDSMIVNDALAAAGYDPTPKQGSKHAEKVAQFRATVDRQLKLLQDRTGKKASNEEVQSVVDNLLVEVVTKPGFIFDTKKRVFELDPGDKPKISADDVPRSERRQIEAALKGRGLPVTEDAILKLYLQHLGNIESGL